MLIKYFQIAMFMLIIYVYCRICIFTHKHVSAWGVHCDLGELPVLHIVWNQFKNADCNCNNLLHFSSILSFISPRGINALFFVSFVCNAISQWHVLHFLINSSVVMKIRWTIISVIYFFLSLFLCEKSQALFIKDKNAIQLLGWYCTFSSLWIRRYHIGMALVQFSLFHRGWKYTQDKIWKIFSVVYLSSLNLSVRGLFIDVSFWRPQTEWKGV